MFAYSHTSFTALFSLPVFHRILHYPPPHLHVCGRAILCVDTGRQEDCVADARFLSMSWNLNVRCNESEMK